MVVANECGGDVAFDKIRFTAKRVEKCGVRFQTGDPNRLKGLAHPAKGFVPMRAIGDYLCNHRIVEWRESPGLA